MSDLLSVVERRKSKLREVLKKLREIQDEADFLKREIADLEGELTGVEREQARQKVAGDETSICVMIENLLEGRQIGMRSDEIARALEDAGHRSRAKNPIASVNTVLYRNRPKVFQRGEDGRWTLARSQQVKKTPSNVVELQKRG